MASGAGATPGWPRFFRASANSLPRGALPTVAANQRNVWRLTPRCWWAQSFGRPPPLVAQFERLDVNPMIDILTEMHGR